MNKNWQLRALSVYLALGVPLGASCAKEANTLEDEPTEKGGSASSGASNKAGGTAKAGNASAFGGTSSKGGAGGKAMGSAGEETTDGGEPGTSGGTAGSSGSGGGGGSGGTKSTGVPPDVLARASVVLHYQTDKGTASTNTIFMKMFIENKSDDPLPMANVKVRYWFTAEATPTLKSFFQGNNIAGQANSFVLDAANSHVLVTFTGNSITKAADLNGNEFQLQIEGGAFNQSNDFSWNAAYTSRQPNDKITVYLADKLIWGCEPSNKCFDDDVGAGGAGAGGAPP